MDQPLSNTTLVTSLYDIGRSNLTGKNAHRSFAKYLNWFQYLLRINVPMVIFVPDELKSYVMEHRPQQYATKVVIRKFEDLAAYKYHDRIQSTIETMTKEPNLNGDIPKYFSECPEFITAKYETIIYSKFDFLHEVSSENPHNTKYFIWLDAGTFYDDPPFDYTLPWPDPYKIQVLGDKFLISNYNFDISDASPLKDKRSYLRLNQNEICAFTLGGTRAAIERVRKQFWNEVDNALNLGVINNEQHILQLMALDHPEYYYLWYRTRYQYPKLPIPLRDRMIPYELARGTFMGETHYVNPNIKLLTIATREVSRSAFERWESTAKYYGYNYEILGQSESWKGFNTKIRTYYDKLRVTTEPYTVLTDCTDVFFCGSSTELYDKFILSGEDIIIGGELEVYYPGGKHDKELIKAHFESFKQSAQAFPNSGFIMGKTNSLVKLMEIHLNYSDDQVACFDTIFENKANISIDYNTTLVGNVPNYHDKPASFRKAVDYFIFDSKIGRYKNVNNDETPVVLHFPGKNWQVMHEFYTVSQHDNINLQSANSSQTGWIFLAIIIAIIIIILFVIFINSR